MNNNKYYTVGTLPKFNRKITERCNIDTPSKHTHDCSRSGVGTNTSMQKVAGLNLSYLP